MRQLTDNRLKEIEQSINGQLHEVVHHMRLENVEHEDNRREVDEIARRLGMDKEELATFAWLELWAMAYNEASDTNDMSVTLFDASGRSGLHPRALHEFAGRVAQRQHEMAEAID